MQPPRIAFWGTPELTHVYLDALARAGMSPVVIITNPDRPKGRGHALAAPAAKEWALAHGINVLQPEKLDDAFYEALTALNLDLSVVVAYGSIIPERCINLPKHGTLNVHYSLLPQYRGASPTEAAILHGDSETGCSIQIMRPALDSGPVIAHVTTPISADETTTTLRTRLTELGASLLVWALPDYLAGRLEPHEQDHTRATRAGKIRKEDGLLDLAGDAVENYRKYRAYIEWPRTFFFADGIRLIVTQAHMEHDRFVVDRVLPEGKKEIAYGDFLKTHAVS
jgi:methionyl-tRNA formyltransferase